MSVLGPLATGRLTTALSWVPPKLLSEAAKQTGVASEAEALCALAGSLSVDIAWVPATSPWASSAVGLLGERGVKTAWAVAGPLGRCAEELGWNEFLRLTASDPQRAARLLPDATRRAVAEANAGARAGADLLVIADDLAGTSGWLVSPDFALDVLLDEYRALANAWSDNGDVIFHSDGDVRALMPALRGAGVAAVHIAIADPGRFAHSVVAAWNSELVAFGGIPAALLHAGELGEVAAQVGERASQGPLVVADDGGIEAASQLDALGRAFSAARHAFAEPATEV